MQHLKWFCPYVTVLIDTIMGVIWSITLGGGGGKIDRVYFNFKPVTKKKILLSIKYIGRALVPPPSGPPSYAYGQGKFRRH